MAGPSFRSIHSCTVGKVSSSRAWPSMSCTGRHQTLELLSLESQQPQQKEKSHIYLIKPHFVKWRGDWPHTWAAVQTSLLRKCEVSESVHTRECVCVCVYLLLEDVGQWRTVSRVNELDDFVYAPLQRISVQHQLTVLLHLTHTEKRLWFCAAESSSSYIIQLIHSCF